MSDKLYTTSTASLKATTADIRNLNAKTIKLNDKNILDYISDSEFDSYDTRDPQLKNDELDIWNTEISLSDNGHIEVKPFEHTKDTISSTQSTTLKSAVKVIENEVLGADDAHIMYWQTDGLTNGEAIFFNCSNLVAFSSDLSSLIDGGDMFASCTALTSVSADLSSLLSGTYMFADCAALTSVSTDLSSLLNGDSMFLYCENLTSFTSNLSNLTNGLGMFLNCTNLASFSADLSSLTEGEGMFSYCENLTTFTSDLPSLTSSSMMFCGCIALTSVSTDLSSLLNGDQMFSGCTALTSFSSDLSSLTNGHMMFFECYDLASFNSDLSKVTDGYRMFCDCNSLTSFSSALSSLTNSTAMFSRCKLDAPSVANIVHTLPISETNTDIHIGIGCNDTAEDQLLFAQECHCDTWQELLDEFSAKNWTVKFQYNSRPTTTYNMRRGATLPVFVKLEEVIMPTEEEKHRKPGYSHTSLDGSKFYQLTYFHSTNGSTDGYTQFNSIEEAEQNFEITPKQRIEK